MSRTRTRTRPTEFRRVYAEHFDYVWTNLRRLGVQSSTLEDAAHDVFMTVHRRWDHFEGRSSMRTWILGITRRVAFRHRRTRARAQRRHEALASVDPPPRLGDDLEDVVARREAEVALQRFLDDLDDGKREAFVLGELEQLGRRELGVALGVNPNTAYSRLRAAREQFSSTFGDPAAITSAREADPAPKDARRRVAALLAVPWGSQAAATPTVGIAVAIGLVALVAARSVVGGHDEDVALPVGTPTSAEPASTTPSPSTPPKPHQVVEPVEVVEPAVIVPENPSPARRRAAKPQPSQPEPPTSELHEEAALIRSARAALGSGSPGRALTLANEHAERFREGLLAEERDAVRIQAQCRLARHDEAALARTAFEREHPHSAHDAAIREVCSTTAVVIKSPRAGDSTG